MTMKTEASARLYERALDILPGGVSSPVRAFGAVGGNPLFIDRGAGPHIFDVDGNVYIDYVLSWGPLILGHAHPDIVDALAEAARRGTSYGAPSVLEIELAELIREFMPLLEMIRFVNSGTEATMSALRLARAYTGRQKIVKFEGCYHGHADMLLVHAGSGVATLGLPDSSGVPSSVAADTLVARYNDVDSVAAIFEAYPLEIGAVIVEPVAGNMGVVPARTGFLEGLRDLCDQHAALLIFDEVMTGFRVHPGGAQALYGIQPDLTALGKVIGGGLPVGAYGGRREMMQMVAPAGPVYQAGTLSGNPLAMTAGTVTLQALQDPQIWSALERRAQALETGIREAAAASDIPIYQTRVGTMFSMFFVEQPVHDWPEVKASDVERFGRYFQAMLAQGVYLAPSQFEAGFLSIVHDDEVIQHTIKAAATAMQTLV
jgi:glutamate-1-semialdehyde 2,1-aminomutase